MLESHLPLLIAAVIAVGVGIFILVASRFLGPRNPNAIKNEAFECGNPTSGSARHPFNARFFMVAILFLIFDIEAVFIYPWAVTFSDAAKGKQPAVSAQLAVLEMVVFVAVIVVGLVYAWRKGALEWGPKQIKQLDLEREQAAE